MKTAILVIALLAASSSALSFEVNKSHKDWKWGTEMNDKGAFIATTISGDGHLQFIVVPENAQCEMSYGYHHYTKTGKQGTAEPQSFTGIPVKFKVDKHTAWIAKDTVTLEKYDTYQSLHVQMLAPGKINGEILDGRRLYVAINYNHENGPTAEDTFSLMGATAAMTAVYTRCTEHLAAFPGYSASKDSRNATLGKQAEKAQQTVADKVNSI